MKLCGNHKKSVRDRKDVRAMSTATAAYLKLERNYSCLWQQRQKSKQEMGERW